VLEFEVPAHKIILEKKFSMIITLLPIILMIILRLAFKKSFYRALTYLKNLFLSTSQPENSLTRFFKKLLNFHSFDTVLYFFFSVLFTIYLFSTLYSFCAGTSSNLGQFLKSACSSELQQTSSSSNSLDYLVLVLGGLGAVGFGYFLARQQFCTPVNVEKIVKKVAENSIRDVSDVVDRAYDMNKGGNACLSYLNHRMSLDKNLVDNVKEPLLDLQELVASFRSKLATPSRFTALAELNSTQREKLFETFFIESLASKTKKHACFKLWVWLDLEDKDRVSLIYNELIPLFEIIEKTSSVKKTDLANVDSLFKSFAELTQSVEGLQGLVKSVKKVEWVELSEELYQVVA